MLQSTVNSQILQQNHGGRNTMIIVPPAMVGNYLELQPWSKCIKSIVNLMFIHCKIFGNNTTVCVLYFTTNAL